MFNISLKTEKCIGLTKNEKGWTLWLCLELFFLVRVTEDDIDIQRCCKPKVAQLVPPRWGAHPPGLDPRRLHAGARSLCGTS